MAVRITLECGDTSSLRPKTTPEGYTHDWEVFLRGVNNAEIHQYVEKVIFLLHETFQKPRRVLKEPPFILKESGYAGFDIVITVVLKASKNEPKRQFEIVYNLNLSNSEVPVSNVMHHTETFSNPTDELRKRLLKGGGVLLSNSNTPDKGEVKTAHMVGKPKLSGNDGKKHKISEPKVQNEFSELFGTPIKTTKTPPEANKKIIEKPANAKPPSNADKSDKNDKHSKIKHSPHKEGKKEKTEDKKEKKDKDSRDKEKNKDKEKSKRSLSPGTGKSHTTSPVPKRQPSPIPAKKPATPPPVVKEKRSASPKFKERESKKLTTEKDKDKIKEVPKLNSEDKYEKSESKSEKSERKKEKKKHKEDREKEKKEKHKEKDREKNKDKDGSKNTEKKPDKVEKTDKDKPSEKKSAEQRPKSPKPVKDGEKPKDEKSLKLENKKESKDRDKPKYKHKKKDKKEKKEGSKDHEKKEKKDKVKNSSEKQNNIDTPTMNSSNSHISETHDRDSSDSAQSGDEDIVENRSTFPSRKEFIAPPPPVPEISRPVSPIVSNNSVSNITVDSKRDKNEKKRDRSKSSRNDDRERKKKRKSENKNEDVQKKGKDRDHSTSPALEPVSSSQSPIEKINDINHSQKTKNVDQDIVMVNDNEQVAPDSTNILIESPDAIVFSDDYVSQLKDLQQKIMTLQDNQELQRVVQVIAETGHYEITKKTFDFDLCALDKQTIQRLQQFFSAS